MIDSSLFAFCKIYVYSRGFVISDLTDTIHITFYYQTWLLVYLPLKVESSTIPFHPFVSNGYECAQLLIIHITRKRYMQFFYINI